MMSELLRRFIWAIGLLIIALGVIFIFASSSIPATSPWQELIREVGITLCSAGVISFLYEVLIRSELLKDYSEVLTNIVNTDAARLGVVALFKSRDEKMRRKGYLLHELIPHARWQLLFFGLGLGQIVWEQQGALREALQRGCNIRLLVFDPSSPHATALERSLGQGSLVQTLHGSMRSIEDFVTALARERLANRLEVRCYDFIPTFGAVAIDHASASGRLIVELNGHDVAGSLCPGIVLENKSGGLFEFYSKQLEALWASSVPLRVSSSGDVAKQQQ